jgi:hypothetical protein
MAKKRKTPAQPGQDWNAPAAELLAELPTDRDELLAAAVAAVVEIDAASCAATVRPPRRPATDTRPSSGR